MKNKFLKNSVVFFALVLTQSASAYADQWSLKNQCSAITYTMAYMDLLYTDLQHFCGEKPTVDCAKNIDPVKLATYLNQDTALIDSSTYYLDENMKFIFQKGPWQMSKIPSEIYRDFGLIRILANAISNFKSVKNKTYYQLRDDLKTVFSDEFYEQDMQKNSLPTIAPEKLKKLFKTQFEDKNSETQIEYDDNKFYMVCLKYTPLHVQGCFDNIKRLLKEYYKGPKQISAIGSTFMADIVSSDRPTLGARKAAQKLIEKYLNKQAGGNLFDDIYESYISSGYSKKEAEKWTWDLIYLAVHHGANGYQYKAYFAQPYNVWTLASALVISSISSYLDSINMKANGKMYSLPKTVKSSCDNGKSYHFWVSAYSARNSLKKGYSESASQWAPFLMDLGYQMFSKSYGRNPDTYIQAGKYGYMNNKNRLDLSFSSAGVQFAIDQKKQISVDDKYNASFSWAIEPIIDSLSSKPYGVDSPKYIVDWLLMMQPSIIQAN